MIDKWSHIFGPASWPTRRGNPFNSNVSVGKATARGEPLWSVTLPERGANGIAVAEDGCCYVSLDNHLVAVSPEGQILWTTQANYAFSEPLVLVSGQLLIHEDHALAIREQKTGKLIATLPCHYSTTPAITPQGHIVYGNQEKSDNRTWLQSMSLSGQQLWAVSIDLAQFRTPLVLDDVIVTTDKSYMRAFNLQGELQWIADQEGFILADPNTRSQLLTKVNPIKEGNGYRVATPIISLGDGRILAGLEWHSGSGYYIFNIHEHSVRPLGIHLELGKPIAVPVFPDRGPCLVTAYRFQHAELGDRKSNIIMVDLNGKPLWHHPLPISPGNIIADVSGNIFTFCGHTFDHWDKYHVWYKLEKQCFVRGISPDGNELFTWYAPGPISPSMAIGKNGELFVVAEGKLWAIG